MGKIALSPLAPEQYPTLPPIKGVRLAAGQAGIKYKDRTDLLLVALDEGTTAAGVFTRSKAPSAPVDWCRDVLANGTARAVVVNSGNANAFTGSKGILATKKTAEAAAKTLGCKEGDVYLASTGVIGVVLDDSKIAAALPKPTCTAADRWAEHG